MKKDGEGGGRKLMKTRGRAICLERSERAQYKVAPLALGTKREGLAKDHYASYASSFLSFHFFFSLSTFFPFFFFFHCANRVLVICTARPRSNGKGAVGIWLVFTDTQRHVKNVPCTRACSTND